MTHSKSFHKLVKQRQIQIIKASDPARRLIDKTFKTSVEWVVKDYRNPVFVFEDDNFFYKVFYRDLMVNGVHFNNKKYMVDLYIKFFHNYEGDLQLNDYYTDSNCTIVQLKKLPGVPISKFKGRTNFNREQLYDWFVEQCKQIHFAGMRCKEKYKMFRTPNHIFKGGYYFMFSDWNKDNILYDSKTNKLHLVDLQPINWIPNDLWTCTVKSQWAELILAMAPQLKTELTRDSVINRNALSDINHLRDTLGDPYIP